MGPAWSPPSPFSSRSSFLPLPVPHPTGPMTSVEGSSHVPIVAFAATALFYPRAAALHWHWHWQRVHACMYPSSPPVLVPGTVCPLRTPYAATVACTTRHVAHAHSHAHAAAGDAPALNASRVSQPYPHRTDFPWMTPSGRASQLGPRGRQGRPARPCMHLSCSVQGASRPRPRPLQSGSRQR